MARVIVSGSIAYDRIMDFPGLFKDHFLPDKLHNINVSFQVDTVAENFGGTAGNIAHNLALLGVEPLIISTAGSDFARYRQYLEGRGIDAAAVHVDESAPTSAAYVMTDKADNQISAFSMGAGSVPYEPLPSAEGAAYTIIAAGCPEDMRTLPPHCRKAALPFLYDPGQALTALSADDVRDGIEGAEVVFGNDYEVNLIVQKTGWSEKDILGQAKALVVTLGEHGSRIVSKDGEMRVPAAPAKEMVDPTGAGDAYRAGFIKGMLAGVSLEKSTKLASTAAAYAVEVYGTQNHTFTLEDLQNRYKEAYGEQCPL